MLYAIDPDLFEASLQHTESRRAVEWLANNIAELEFAFDRQHVLIKEYATFLEKYINQKEHLAVIFLNDLLSWQKSKIAKVDSLCSHDLQELIDCRDCDEPVEPTLIGMGEHAPTLGLTILLTMQAAKVRKRGLHDPSVCQEFCKRLPKLRVKYAHPKISMPSMEAESKTEKDLWFEDKMRLIASQVFDGRPRQKTPPSVEAALGGRGADVDVYIYREQNDCRDVWIGECKLHKMNNDHWVGINKVQQLERRLPVVSEYERAKIPADKELNVHSIVISNVANMAPEAWKLAGEIGAIFWHAELSEAWRERKQWHVVQVNEYIPEAPSDVDSNWRGRFVRRIPVE
jgi:hypothetical protein